MLFSVLFCSVLSYFVFLWVGAFLFYFCRHSGLSGLVLLLLCYVSISALLTLVLYCLLCVVVLCGITAFITVLYCLEDRGVRALTV